MKKVILLFIVLSILVSACSKNISITSELDVSTTMAATTEQDKTPVVSTKPETPKPDIDNSKAHKKLQMETTIYKPENSQDISDKFAEAIPLLAENLIFNVSTMNLQESNVKLTILNAYFNVLNQNPALKYAYAVDSEYNSNTFEVKCSIKYMPYKTGNVNINNLPAGTYKISNLKDLIAAVQNSAGRKNIPIAIINPDLDVDKMQNALMQAGYGYIVYSLNNNATEIISGATGGRTIEECTSYINKTSILADEIISKIISTGMTPDEKLAEIYRYITKNVVYDQRYYTDKKAMPYESTTAYGALMDNKAICGGYSWAFNVLLSKVGIECYNVTGSSSKEYHMWNIAKYNDMFYYFDCTFDRGKIDNYNYFAKTAEVFSKNHLWNMEFISELVKDTPSEKR